MSPSCLDVLKLSQRHRTTLTLSASLNYSGTFLLPLAFLWRFPSVPGSAVTIILDYG
jgi:hypothetical protein